MLLRFNEQTRIAENGVNVRSFEKGSEHEVSEEFGKRILEVFPNTVIQIKKEAPKLTIKKADKDD
jgi:hypothetical protein